PHSTDEEVRAGRQVRRRSAPPLRNSRPVRRPFARRCDPGSRDSLRPAPSTQARPAELARSTCACRCIHRITDTATLLQAGRVGRMVLASPLAARAYICDTLRPSSPVRTLVQATVVLVALI